MCIIHYIEADSDDIAEFQNKLRLKNTIQPFIIVGKPRGYSEGRSQLTCTPIDNTLECNIHTDVPHIRPPKNVTLGLLKSYAIMSEYGHIIEVQIMTTDNLIIITPFGTKY